VIVRMCHQADVTHLITLTSWESLEAIRAFAGEDAEKAKYSPEDADFLLEYEPRVVHYEVVGKSWAVRLLDLEAVHRDRPAVDHAHDRVDARRPLSGLVPAHAAGGIAAGPGRFRLVGQVERR